MSLPEIPPALPLVAYAEQLCRGARVLVVGWSALPVAEAVLSRGARMVHVFERDPVRRSELQARAGSGNITVGPPEEGMREGFFDLILVENLANDPDPEATTRSLARLMAPRGAALFAAPNPDAKTPLFPAAQAGRALDYYALYDAVRAGLPYVRMLGQVPFVGYALIDFAAEGEPSPVFDTSLIPARGEEPEYFVAFAAHHARTLDEYAVVQLPSAALPRGGAAVQPIAPVRVASEPAPAPKADDSRVRELERQLARQETWIAELEARAATADERADAADERADAAEERASAADEQLRAADERAKATETRLDELREKLGNREQLLGGEAASLRSERDEARAEVERLKRKINDLSDLLELKKTELEALTSDPATVAEFERVEAQLKQQGHTIRRLESELREAERIGRTLVRKLAVPREPALAVAPGASALEVAERLVQAEAELVSLRWSLSILTRGQSVAAVAPGVEQ